jgi:hypothetical protein
MAKTLKKLSAYTSARNCTDYMMCEYGIRELKEYMAYKEKKGHKIPSTVYIKFYRLKKKQDKLREK